MFSESEVVITAKWKGGKKVIIGIPHMRGVPEG
jgi:hypothetical protein